MNTQKTIVIFSGKPGAGKDTAADWFVAKYGAKKLQCKDALWAMARTMLHELHGNSAGEVLYQEAINSTAGGFKDTNPVYNGMTFRELLIFISETLVKPVFGPAIFGKKLAADAFAWLVAQGHDLVVVPDCGFASELAELANLGGKLVHVRIESSVHADVVDSREKHLQTLMELTKRWGWPTITIHNPNNPIYDTKAEFYEELHDFAFSVLELPHVEDACE